MQCGFLPCVCFPWFSPPEDSIPNAKMVPDTWRLLKKVTVAPTLIVSCRHLVCIIVCGSHTSLYAVPCIFTLTLFFLVNYSRKFRNVGWQGILVFLPLVEHWMDFSILKQLSICLHSAVSEWVTSSIQTHHTKNTYNYPHWHQVH